MLLTVDIGNTNISFGIFKAARLIRRFDILTKTCSFKKIKARLGGLKIADCLISSVVPEKTKRLQKELKNLLGKRAHILGNDWFVPIKNLYRHPKQVGQDRLVNTYAAITKYKAPLIVIDFGTAITFDVVSKNEEYSGGMILAGLELSLAALAKHTALLPKIKLKPPKELIGRDTQSCVLSGLIYGFSALTDGLIKRIKKEIGASARVVATGGNASLISRYCQRIDQVDEDLTLEGLNLIYESLKSK